MVGEKVEIKRGFLLRLAPMLDKSKVTESFKAL